jgi:hypothetical protein
MEFVKEPRLFSSKVNNDSSENLLVELAGLVRNDDIWDSEIIGNSSVAVTPHTPDIYKGGR